MTNTPRNAARSPGARQRNRLRVALAVVASVVLCTFVPASVGNQTSDAKAQREEVRRQKAAVAAQINGLNADVEQLSDAVEVLDANLRVEEAALQNAQAQVDQATAEAQEILNRKSQTQADLERMEQAMRNVAIEAYSKPPAEGLVTLQSADLNEAVRKQALLDIVGNNNLDITEQIKGLKAELATLETERLAALARAEQAKAEVQGRHDQVAQAQAQQQAALDALDARLDRLLSERDQLTSQDKALSAEIERQARLAAEAAARARRSGSSGTRYSVPGAGELVSVSGITVHVSIADNLRNLLDAADADGVNLGGSGYRDSSSQISLRRAHCGSSDYDIYQKPASQCRPPTARPGSSNHERGLAVDFTQGGSVLTRGSSGFRWLQANAGRFGFQNLPSEPWHWSPDGN